jgi:hypothetical protein
MRTMHPSFPSQREVDFLEHKALYWHLEELLRSLPSVPLSVLDLGCGDCTCTAATLRAAGVQLASFTGEPPPRRPPPFHTHIHFCVVWVDVCVCVCVCVCGGGGVGGGGRAIIGHTG